MSVNEPPELEQRLGGGWYSVLRPGQEVELSDGARLAGLEILQVEAAHQVLIAPDVFRHQMHLAHHRCFERMHGVRYAPGPDAPDTQHRL